MEDAYVLFDKWVKAREFLVVGKNTQRVDALDKARGKAKYVEDELIDGMLFARLVKGEYAHALIQEIDDSKAREMPGVISILTAKDIPGKNQVGFGILDILDQPLFADSRVRFYGEPLAVVVAENPNAAEEALAHVEVKYKQLPVILDSLEAMNSKALVHEERGSNIVLTQEIRKGNAEEGFSKSKVVVENVYKTQYQDHAYLETEGALGIPTPDGVKIIGQPQYPRETQGIVSRILGLPSSRVEVIVPAIGGAFGGKGGMAPEVCGQAALAAFKLQKPVMMNYTREDSLISHCKRAPYVIKHKLGADENGKLTAIEAQVVVDSGAYSGRGPTILFRSAIHVSGPYVIPNVKIDSFLTYTNKVPISATRGFGAPEVQFAAESQMDELAEKLGIDPVDFRLKNLLKEGSYTCTNQLLETSVGIREALSKVAEASGWKSAKKSGEGLRRRGMGVSCGWYGTSSSGGLPDWSDAFIAVNKDGSLVCYTGLVELGQGSHTIATQIIGEVLGVPLSQVTIRGGMLVPDTGSTTASRATSIGTIGILVAAAKLRERIDRVAADILSCSPSEVRIENGIAYSAVKLENQIAWNDLVKRCYQKSIDMNATGYYFVRKGTFDREKGQGVAYPGYAFSVNIVEVEVDMETGKVKVLKNWPALSSGRILNPLMTEGQIEGGFAYGLGYSLMEEVLTGSDGSVMNPSLADYLIPTSSDMPEFQEPIFVEDISSYGTFGAKGLGELVVIPVVGAIANAIHQATGVRIRELPITPEKLYFAIKKAGKGV